jgi:pimeloyl-ACP methyl ester carboxylesterase
VGSSVLVFAAVDGTQLEATLVTPLAESPTTAALLISGSGPLDRDSNMAGQQLGVASALAAALEQRGVGSLRFDKRGVGASAGDYLRTGFELEVSDASCALDALRTDDRVDPRRVVVIGHSVGATIAIRLAARTPTLTGVVLLSVACRSGADVMAWQSTRIARTLRWPARLFADRVVRRQAEVRRQLATSTDDVLRLGRTELPARWFREYMAYDPTSDLAAITCPVLAITGRDDVQVDPDDVALVGELVGGDVTGEIPASVNHLLRRHQGPPGLSGYRAQLRQPADPNLLDRIADWVAATSGGASERG